MFLAVSYYGVHVLDTNKYSSFNIKSITFTIICNLMLIDLFIILHNESSVTENLLCNRRKCFPFYEYSYIYTQVDTEFVGIGILLKFETRPTD